MTILDMDGNQPRNAEKVSERTVAKPGNQSHRGLAALASSSERPWHFSTNVEMIDPVGSWTKEVTGWSRGGRNK